MVLGHIEAGPLGFDPEALDGADDIGVEICGAVEDQVPQYSLQSIDSRYETPIRFLRAKIGVRKAKLCQMPDSWIRIEFWRGTSPKRKLG
jgi:hypothetical protein